MKLLDIEVNSKPKADRIRELLGKRYFTTVTVHYAGKQISGWIISYRPKEERK